MLAEPKCPDALASTLPREALSPPKDSKDVGIHPKLHDGKDRQQRSGPKSCCFLGLETWTELVWEDWDLGKEYTKTVVLKNVNKTLQKLHIRPPVSRFFSTTIPQKLVLSPGISLSIPVTFRPLKKCEHEDRIELHNKDVSFRVFLRAILPSFALEMPDTLVFPLCAVQHSTHSSFMLKNASKLQTYFQWEGLGPFELSPKQGLLKSNEKSPVTVVFRPQEALVYQQLAYCTFGEEADKVESACTILLQGTAKYPHLEFLIPNSSGEEKHGIQVLNFGSVAIGQCSKTHFDVYNPSSVIVLFFLSRLSGGVPLFGSEFTCDVTKGEVGPGRSLRVTVTFTPAMVDFVYMEHLTLIYAGALCEPQLTLTGNCRGPEVSLLSHMVNFGCIEEGGSVEEMVTLVNSSDVEAFYRWDIDCAGHSVFTILPASGTVLPLSHTTLRAVYRPTQAIAHHRKVACLILHQGPMFIDLIGTCHSEAHKPVTLKPEHLIFYKLQWPHKQGSTDTHSSSFQQDPSVEMDLHKSSLLEQEVLQDDIAVMSSTEEFYQAGSRCVDFPLSALSPLPVTVMPTELRFNHKATTSVPTKSAYSQAVTITNHTKEKLSLVWTVCADSPFSVSPSSCDLAPLKSTSFRVVYEPKEPNNLHGAQLECFAYYKLHFDKGLLCPPWCVTVRVIGHSIQPGKQHFVDRCTVKPPKVVFPALSVISCQTLLLKNEGDQTLTFCLDFSSDLALVESASVVPGCGLIQPGAHQVIALRMTATEDNPTKESNLKLQLNGANFTKELPVVSVVEQPCVSLEDETSLYFQPTAVGSRTKRTLHIRNLSSLPTRFQWSIPEPDQGLIHVEPHAGELHPNEISYQTWFFSPLENRKYTFNPALYFWLIQSDGSNKSQLSLTVVGLGSEGAIEAEEAVQDLGEILVGSYQSAEVPLVNNSPCAVAFCLSVVQKILHDEHIDNSEAEPCALRLDCERGTIGSHCTMELRATVRPNRRAQYCWAISYQPTNANGLVSSPPQRLCVVRAKGVYPTLQVIDGWSTGSMNMLSKVYLWKLFSLDSLNDYLRSNPSSVELLSKPPTKHGLRRPSIFTKTLVDFNFSSAPVNSEPATVVLMFHNPGSIPVDWTFLFPKDQEIELEYWAVTGEFTSTELYQMKVQDNQLFSISPRSGTLLPGQKRAVHFNYRHEFIGIDRFPVVFKLSYGREILLNFHGVTKETDRPYLNFASTRHAFASVAIGDANPPRQLYEFHNGGVLPVHYEVDTAVLSELQKDNFNHPALRCLNPEGEVLPGKVAMLEWIFFPLEPKLYQVVVPIRVQGWDSQLVRFEGWGVDPSTFASSKSLTHSDSKTTADQVQRVPFPGQVLFLSEDRVDFGNIPVNKRISRILFLNNVSHTDTIYFEWDLSEQSSPQVVQLHPDRGRLRPRECVLCVLTFTSTDYPAVHQLNLLCQLFCEDELSQYHRDLKQWEEERERQQGDSGKPNKRGQRILVDEDHLPASSRKGPPLRKYKTLPPICARSSFETKSTLSSRLTNAERKQRRDDAKTWRRPAPPETALLHLEVAARSHGLEEYMKHFPALFRKHCRNFQSDETTAALCARAHSGPDRDIMCEIFTSLLRDICDDRAFVQLLNTLHSKPDPYEPRQASIFPPSSFPSSSCPDASPTSSPPPTQQPPLPPSVVEGGDETAGGSEMRLQTEGGKRTQRAPSEICEDVVTNTLQNLMMEVVRGEVVFMAHSPTIISPPSSSNTSTSTSDSSRDTG